jgi:hypothetical protein
MGTGELCLISVIIALLCINRRPDIFCGLAMGLRRFRDELRRLTSGFDQGSEDAGRSLGGILGKPAAQAITADNQVAELYEPTALKNESPSEKKARRQFKALLTIFLRFVRWLASGR